MSSSDQFPWAAIFIPVGIVAAYWLIFAIIICNNDTSTSVKKASRGNTVAPIEFTEEQKDALKDAWQDTVQNVMQAFQGQGNNQQQDYSQGGGYSWA